MRDADRKLVLPLRRHEGRPYLFRQRHGYDGVLYRPLHYKVINSLLFYVDLVSLHNRNARHEISISYRL